MPGSNVTSSARSFASSIFFIRLYLLAAAVLCSSAFGILDALISEEYRSTLWSIRYGFAVPIMAVIFVLSFTRSFERYVQMVRALRVQAA